MDANQAITQTNEELFKPVELSEPQAEQVEEVAPEPVDILQEQMVSFREAEPRTVRGAHPKMQVDTSVLTEVGLGRAYKKAKDDSDYYAKTGNKQYARMVKEQYMQDHFLPAVDALIKLNGMGAVQTNKDVLAQLDQLTLLDGTRGQGYTESFIMNLYRPEGQVERSDAQVVDGVKAIQALCESEQIRTAVGRANDLKRRIDRGENVATPEDYEIVQKVALYGQ